MIMPTKIESGMAPQRNHRPCASSSKNSRIITENDDDAVSQGTQNVFDRRLNKVFLPKGFQ